MKNEYLMLISPKGKRDDMEDNFAERNDSFY